MDFAASTSPLSTFDKALSTCLEKKGTVPTTRGTIAPVVPIAVPTINLEKGIRAASRITKGIERNTLISRSKIPNTLFFSRIPPCFVTIRVTPRIIPSKNAMPPETSIIYRVCKVESHSSSSFEAT